MTNLKKLKSVGAVAVVMALTFPQTILAQAGSGGWSVDALKNMETGLPEQTIYTIIEHFLMWLLAGFGIVGIIGFVIAGILYVIAFGDSSKMETAKNAMYYSIIGVVVGLVGLVAVAAIDTALRGVSIF